METEIAEKVLTVVGFAELNASNSKLFVKRVRAALNGHTVVEIDLSKTTCMDCTGLGALIAISNPVHHRKIFVRLINPTSQVQQLLHVMHAGQILEIVDRRRLTTPTVQSIETTPRTIRPDALLARQADVGAAAGGAGLAPAIG
jgi:anti-anti-sigma factor